MKNLTRMEVAEIIRVRIKTTIKKLETYDRVADLFGIASDYEECLKKIYDLCVDVVVEEGLKVDTSIDWDFVDWRNE